MVAILIKFMNYIRNFVGEGGYGEDPRGAPRGQGYSPIDQFSDAKREFKKKINSPMDLIDYFQSRKAREEQYGQ